MRQLQPVVWSKGTFLTPQHLQVQDRFIESALEFKLNSLRFCPWGFRELEINREALATGNFAVSRAVGIFPDGLPFDIPDSDAAPDSKPLAPFFEPEQDSLDVYLAIPQYHEHGRNISASRKSGDTRYIAEVAVLRDENSGLAEKPVEVARKNLRLLVQGEARLGSTTMQIARVMRSATGSFQLDPSFVPPLLDIAASEYLISVLRRLVGILSAKSSNLAGMRRQKNASLADFSASDIPNFWLLYTINTFFPIMRHLYEVRKGHPEALFSTMSALAGALTTFSSTIQPHDLPSYDHENLTRGFTDLDEKLRELLETVVPSNFVSLPLKLIQPSVYAASISNDKYLRNTKMYLAVSSNMSEVELIDKAPHLIKVCSAAHIETLIRQAMPGLQLMHVPAPPGSVPIKLNYQYFVLNQSGVAWEAITRARNFAAYVPADIPEPQLELLILLPQAE